MSKHDFSATEFAERRARAREAIGAAGLDWFCAIHPVSIRWLTGSDAKSYQEFQCLLISAKPGPISVLTMRYDPGRPVKYAGCLFIVGGIFLMFYMRAYFFKKPAQGQGATS